jgi:hypothetical protein
LSKKLAISVIASPSARKMTMRQAQEILESCLA